MLLWILGRTPLRTTALVQDAPAESLGDPPFPYVYRSPLPPGFLDSSCWPQLQDLLSLNGYHGLSQAAPTAGFCKVIMPSQNFILHLTSLGKWRTPGEKRFSRGILGKKIVGCILLKKINSRLWCYHFVAPTCYPTPACYV